jgi:hypothetical protein
MKRSGMKQSRNLRVFAIASSFLLAMTNFGSFICWNTLNLKQLIPDFSPRLSKPALEQGIGGEFFYKLFSLFTSAPSSL